MQSSKYTSEEIERRDSIETVWSDTAKLNNDSDVPSSTSVSMDTSEKKEPEATLTNKEKMKLMMQYAMPLVTMLLIDVALPLILFYVLKIWLNLIVALVLSGIPPLLHIIYKFWKKRKVDVLGCIIVITFILTAVLSLNSGDVRVALLRDSATTAFVSVLFFISLIPLKTRWFRIRPLVFVFGKQMMEGAPPHTWTDIEGEKHEKDQMEFIWELSSMFRKHCYIVSGLWGVVLMGEFAAKVIMIKSTLSVEKVVLYGNIIVAAVVGLMIVGSTVTSTLMQKKIVVLMAEWKSANDFTKK
ncbi:uncharacterized protein EV154DRAFT_466616 [Mucor mucedo]|uniref:uncharacterized protein n=1 Tax=Mucor mucedo TaxID=29922 RepID=UPI00221E618C|nr:uncharacterized protein EV154DRAFT_466616 [Mucor mucedo]KAI7889882.1 hypothetical protein EV154DRAFT_466616 [Mucor mucedo]